MVPTICDRNTPEWGNMKVKEWKMARNVKNHGKNYRKLKDNKEGTNEKKGKNKRVRNMGERQREWNGRVKKCSIKKRGKMRVRLSVHFFTSLHTDFNPPSWLCSLTPVI